MQVIVISIKLHVNLLSRTKHFAIKNFAYCTLEDFKKWIKLYLPLTYIVLLLIWPWFQFVYFASDICKIKLEVL